MFGYSKRTFLRLLLVLSVFLIGLVLTSAVVYKVYSNKINKIDSQFKESARVYAYDIQSILRSSWASALSLRAFFYASHYVSPGEFKIFSDHLFKDFPGIDVLAWIPYVSEAEREAYESKARKINPSFSFRLTRENPPVEIFKKEGYFPIYYINPYVGNENLLGLDVSSDRLLWPFMMEARHTGKVILSDRVDIEDGDKKNPSVWFFLAVYKTPIPYASVEERSQNFIGFISGIYNLKNIFNSILNQYKGLDFVILDATNQKEKKLVYTSLTMFPQLSLKDQQLVLQEKMKRLYYQYYFKIADRTWFVYLFPQSGFFQLSELTEGLIALITGLGLLLSLMLFFLAYRWFLREEMGQLKIKMMKGGDKLMSGYDRLTGLPNRFLLEEIIDLSIVQARTYTRRFAVIYIDLDHFERINQLLDFTSGDAVLQDVAVRLKGTMTPNDTVAHISGDKFVIIAHEENIAAFYRLLDRIMKTIRKQLIIKDRSYFLNCSIGIAIYPDSAEGARELLKNAQIAMETAKRAGGNGFQFHSQIIDMEVKRALMIEAQLYDAIKKNELSLRYQPIVSLTTGKIIAVEALLRWKNDQLGDISPEDFIQIAEKNGEIIPITDWVLERGCIQNAHWQRRGLISIPISVNITPRYFYLSDFSRRLSQILKDSKMPPVYLELEVVERAFFSSFKEPAEFLRHKKIRLAIDDFGTGYSNLAYLARFGVDRLKIDIEFVRGLPKDNSSVIIVQAIINLGHSLSMHVTAEGVETKEQYQFLKKAGCDSMQGFYYSKPLTAEDFELLLEKNNQ